MKENVVSPHTPRRGSERHVQVIHLVGSLWKIIWTVIFTENILSLENFGG